ncbi:MAG: DUF370 domain-containing protein [Clostridia bacterium]|nr:DUF370 domain-containing protein [Clostridia bacterium]
MFVPIGGETVLRSENIIGIFDTDSATVSKHSRALLNTAEKQKKVRTVSLTELPRSFLLVKEKNEIVLYLSPVSASTLIRRIQ